MAGGDDKTEKPTAKRLAKARSSGNVAKSMDLSSAVVLMTATYLLINNGQFFMETFKHYFTDSIQLMASKPVFTNTLVFNIIAKLISQVAAVLMPFVLTMTAAGVIVNFIQLGFKFTTEPLKPTLGKLNPIKGFHKIFGSKDMVIQLLKSSVKMSIIAFIAYTILNNHRAELMAMGQLQFMGAWEKIQSIIRDMMVNISATMLIIGIIDYFYQKHSWMKKMRMSKQEVKDEGKSAEGDGKVKGKIKAMGRQIIQKQMLAAVKTADVIVTNPTHFSVALRYDPDIAPAPFVVAKGVDSFAFKIREVAKAHGVPIKENRMLARSLYAIVDVNSMVPPELFVAVAEVLAFVFQKRKGRKMPEQNPTGRAPQSSGGTR